MPRRGSFSCRFLSPPCLWNLQAVTYNCDSCWCMHVLPRDSVECGYLDHLLDGDVNSVGGCRLLAGPDSNETQVAFEFVDDPTWAARVELHIGGETTVASLDTEVTMRDQLLPWIWFGSCDGAAPLRLPGTVYLFRHASVGGLCDWTWTRSCPRWLRSL